MTPPAFGAHRQCPGASSVAAARGAFKCRRKGLGVVRIAVLRLWPGAGGEHSRTVHAYRVNTPLRQVFTRVNTPPAVVFTQFIPG